MNPFTTYYVIGPDNDGDEEIPYYYKILKTVYLKPGPAQKALDTLIGHHELLSKYHESHKQYLDVLRAKRVLPVKFMIV